MRESAAIRRSDAEPVQAQAPRSFALRSLTRLVPASVFLLPLVVSPTSYGVFREPKEFALRACVLFIAAFLIQIVTEAPAEAREQVARHRPLAILLTAICGWFLLSYFTAAFKIPAAEALLRGLSFVVFSIGVLVTARIAPQRLLTAVFASTVINTLVLIAQAVFGVMPFEVDAQKMDLLRRTALLGNPNDVGSTLAPVAVAAVVCALSTRKNRNLAIAGSALFLLGVILSQAFTAAVAATAGIAVFALVRFRRRATVAAALAIVVAALSFAVIPPLRERLLREWSAVRDHRITEVASSRVIPFLTAYEMFRTHPVTGVGIGGFAPNFFEYRLRVDSEYAALRAEPRAEWSPARRANFGEAHNEWLQTAAELGLPGVALLIATLLFVVLRAPRSTPDASFARGLAIPLVVTFAVLACAHFPLRTVSPALIFITLGGYIVAQREESATP